MRRKKTPLRRIRKPVKVKRALQRALESREAIRLVCRLGPGEKMDRYHKGFVVGLGDGWVLLHALFLDPFVLNGYVYLRVENIRYYELIGGPDQFVGRALSLRGLERSVPAGVDAASLADLIRTAGEKSPVISIYAPGGWYIGSILKVGRKRVEVRVFDEEAACGSIYRIPLRAITKVEFDDGYGRALWQVNQAFHNTLLADALEVGNE